MPLGITDQFCLCSFSLLKNLTPEQILALKALFNGQDAKNAKDNDAKANVNAQRQKPAWCKMSSKWWEENQPKFEKFLRSAGVSATDFRHWDSQLDVVSQTKEGSEFANFMYRVVGMSDPAGKGPLLRDTKPWVPLPLDPPNSFGAGRRYGFDYFVKSGPKRLLWVLQQAQEHWPVRADLLFMRIRLAFRSRRNTHRLRQVKLKVKHA